MLQINTVSPLLGQFHHARLLRIEAEKASPSHNHSVPEKGCLSDAPVNVVTPLSSRRLWLFRFSAMILGPLFVFGSVELALRVAGCGYPTSFFLRTRINGHEFFVPNAKFTFRFFSATQARPTLPIRMAADKPTNTFRIFLLGESAANGDPDPTFGMGRYLQVLLGERFPKTDFEVLCVAITGINSHTILPIARECARHQGDLWLVYMGNNEMVGPFGAETVFGPRAPSLGLVRATLAVKTTRTGQLLDALAEHLKRPSASLKSWGGMQMFMENRLPHDHPARLRAQENFRRNLEDILRAGRRAGVPVVLSTVAVNLKDCAPFASLHAPGLGATEEASWNKTYEEGVALETSGSYREALAAYQAAARIDPQYADLQFRAGRCDLALTNYDQARRDFELAADYDALAFRADTPINQAIKAAAARHAGQGVYLVDAADALAQSSPTGIPGCELFYEHVHLNFEGDYLVALKFAEQVRRLLPNSITAHDVGNWASAALCDRRLAVTVWDRQRVWQPIFNRISSPPFTGQLNHAAFFNLCEAKLDEAKKQMSVQTPEQARQVYEEALTRSPEDNLLHGNFEQFLEAGGNLAQAITEAQRVCELVPHLPGPYYYAGSLLIRQGRTREAEEYFARAVALRGDYAEAHNALGLLFAGQQKTAQAAACFTRARRADPNSADAYLNLGFLEQLQGNLDRAMAQYDEAARLQPQGPADYFNRAVKLSAAHRSAEAIECFRTLLQQVPAFWQAHFLLGAELAAGGRNAEARAQFAEVLRYRPDYAQILPRLSDSVQDTPEQQGAPAR
jgi:tetratricopeptide (TPR) repeat protein